MSFDPLKATIEIAITAIAEQLYDDWPPSCPEEVITGVKKRLRYRLYGDLDDLENEEE